MRALVMLLWLGAACGCLFSRVERPPRLTPEEAVRRLFPAQLPDAGRVRLPGPLARAELLASEEVFPPGLRMPEDRTPLERCQFRPDAYAAEVVPLPGPCSSNVEVRLTLERSRVCPGAPDEPVMPHLASPHRFIVDTRTWRIGMHWQEGGPPPPTNLPEDLKFLYQDLPAEGRLRVSGRQLASMRLAFTDLLPKGVRAPANAWPGDLCHLESHSWDVGLSESGPTGEYPGLVFVHLSFNGEHACPELGLLVMAAFDYAIDPAEGVIVSTKWL